MRTIRLLRPLFLVLALLFVQQGAAVHGLAHVLAEQTQDKSLAHDQPCELCVAYAQIGSAAVSDAVCFDFSAPCAGIHHFLDAGFLPAPCAAFAARAPPVA
jgi:hypothetical protein